MTMGTPIRQIVFDIGGGIPNGKSYKAVQIGGPSGGCLTREHLDLPLDYDSLRGVGAMVGSGGLVAMNEKTCMVSIARFFMDFTQRESCGKCVLCREGTRRLSKSSVASPGPKQESEGVEALERLRSVLAHAEPGRNRWRHQLVRPGADRARYFSVLRRRCDDRDRFKAHI